MSALALVRMARECRALRMVREARRLPDFNAALHPRDDEGKFRTVFNRVNRALTAWARGDGSDRPISDLKLSRPSLIRVARKMGYEPRRGESADSIEDGILAKAREIDAKRQNVDLPDEPDAPEAPDVDRLFTAAEREQAEKILSRLPQGEFEKGIANPKRTRKELSDTARLLGLPSSGSKEALQKRLADRAAQLRKGGVPESPAVAKVQAADVAAPFDQRVAGAARQWARVANLPPVKVEVDASAGSDTGRWRATDVTGLTGSPSEFLTAMTARVRDSGHLANSRLRFPDGRPMEEWEVKLRAGYPADKREQFEALEAARRVKNAETADRHIKAIDKAMERSKLPSDAVLWRGIRPSDVGLPVGDATGFEWTDLGYVGTSARRDVAANSFDSGAVLRILAPSGTPAIGIQGGGEAEILLGRGQRFRVVADRRTASGARELDVEIVPEADSSDLSASADVAAKLQTATSRDEARELLAGKTSAELREIAESAGVAVPSKASKTTLVADIVQHTVGRRLTSDAIASPAVARVRKARNS